jgi:hypothetical protein
MPMLGDILSDARRSAVDVEQWLKTSDHQLFTCLAEAAAAEGVSLRGFVRMAVADFGQFATEEEWTTLIARLRDSDAPGTTCLIAMLKWRLALADMTTETALPKEKELGHG